MNDIEKRELLAHIDKIAAKYLPRVLIGEYPSSVLEFGLACCEWMAGRDATIHDEHISVADKAKLLSSKVELLRLKYVNSGYDYGFLSDNEKGQVESAIREIDKLLPPPPRETNR